MTPVDSPADPVEETSPSRRVTVGRVAAVVLCLSFVAMWAYVFAAAGDYHPAGWLEDRTFPEAAERACKPFADELAALPPASSVSTAAERADLVDEGSAILRRMQAALEPLVPGGTDGRHIGEWVSDWSTHIEDRDRYAARLRRDPGAEFLESTKGESSQLSSALDQFADTNRMPSCVTAEDV